MSETILKNISADKIDSAQKQYGKYLCEPCKAKLAKMVQNLSTIDKLFPLRTAQRFQKAICEKCRRKLLDQLRQK